MYHDLAAAMFDEACRLVGKPNTEIAEILRRELGRDSLTRNTVAAWRACDQPVPAAALLAMLKQTNTLAIEVTLLVMLRNERLRGALPDDLEGALERTGRRLSTFRAYAAARDGE